MNEM